MVCLVIKTPLAKDNVCTRVLDFLHHISIVGCFHVGQFLVVCNTLDLNSVLCLGLWWFKGASEDTNLGIADFLGHGGVRKIFVDDETLDKGWVFDCASQLADDLDKVKVDILSVNVCNVQDRFYSNVSKKILAFWNNFAPKSSSSALTQEIEVILFDVDGLSDFHHFVYSNFTCLFKSISNFKWVNSFIQKFLCLF